jgi:hypothetical protein
MGASDLLSPAYLKTLDATIRTRILGDRDRESASIVDYLLSWSLPREKLFMAMYDAGLFRSKMWDSSGSSLKRFFHRIESARGNVQGNGSYTNLVYHAHEIQSTMDLIHDGLVRDKSGFEYRLVYEVLKTKNDTEGDP